MSKLTVKPYTFWFVTGSQHLYGPETLLQVDQDSQQMVEGLNASGKIPYRIVFKPVVKTSEEIYQVLTAANQDEDCAGIITWMHTFSPAKMWISGLSALRKPLLHLHTQFNQDIPWDSIDMDFMNLNQAAHGDREYGFIGARMGVARKVVVGYWAHAEVQERIAAWTRTAVAYTESKKLKVARFGDNMRQVAVTEGDKVEAQIKLGWSVQGYGIGDLVDKMNEVTDEQVQALYNVYAEQYEIADAHNTPEARAQIEEQARIELGLRAFLEEGGYTAFTTTFEDLHGMKQLPGLAVQRLMADGYGFGGEGDWKTAALVRLMKIMADNEGTSFMEDYTYHLAEGSEMVLGAHMLEVCPTIADSKPKLEVHPLGIGDKEDPARLVFNGRAGTALNATIIDLGNRFRMVVNEVEAKEIEQEMPNLPVARVLWSCQPSLKEGIEAWIHAGGAHHTCFSYNVTSEQLEDFANMLDIECAIIDSNLNIRSFRNELRWNDIAYRIRG